MSLAVRLATFAASLSTAAADTDVADHLHANTNPTRSARDDLNRAAAEKQEEVERLKAALKEAQDNAGSAWGAFKSFFGDDAGAADTAKTEPQQRTALFPADSLSWRSAWPKDQD